MELIDSKESFKQFVEKVQGAEGYRNPLAFGICRVQRGQENSEKILQAVYPLINWNENFGSAAIFMAALEEAGFVVDCSEKEGVYPVTGDFINAAMSAFSPYHEEAEGDAHKNVQVIQTLSFIHKERGLKDEEFEVVFLFEDAAPESVEAVYLKLYAYSQQKAPLRSLNLNGAFGALHNVAWSGNDAIELEWLRANEIELKLTGEYPVIDYVDKFPRFLMHVIPADNTRILDTSRVRMGASVAPGTTVMPGASYINFNAGTTGPVMVEGRISSSAVVGPGSDVGGGASILGVLSGTDGNPISIGENTLLGANSTCGVPLGDGCIIDGGLAIFAGTKLFIAKGEAEKIASVNPEFKATGDDMVVKAAELAGMNGIHFRQDSQSGQMIARRSTREVKLNAELH